MGLSQAHLSSLNRFDRIPRCVIQLLAFLAFFVQVTRDS